MAEGGNNQKMLAQHLPFMESVSMLKGKATAYLCENFTCKEPTTEVEKLQSLLTLKF